MTTWERSPVMSLVQLITNYRDGDEHGWAREINYLWAEHTAKMDMLTTSIQETGIQTPIVLGSDGRVWDGHHRIAAAIKLGFTEVPVVYSEELS